MKGIAAFSLPPDDVQQIRERFPELQLALCPNNDGIEPHLADADMMIVGFRLPEELVRRAPKLRWVQSLFNGVEGILSPVFAERGITLTNFRGASAPNMAEHILAMMLAFARGLPEFARRQAQGQWRPQSQPPPLFELSGQRLGIVGFGETAKELARRAKGFDMEIWATRRSGGGAAQHLDRLLPAEALPEMLAWADHLALAAPATPATRGIIGAEALSRMRPDAYIYNVSRGELIDQPALIEALRTGRIAGAGLDVTTPEPLPADSPLWQMPNVIITGHTSGVSPLRPSRATELLLDNIARFLAGQTLRNIVDPAAGY